MVSEPFVCFGLVGFGLDVGGLDVGVDVLLGEDFGDGLDDLTELDFDLAFELLDDFVDDRELLLDELLLDELLLDELLLDELPFDDLPDLLAILFTLPFHKNIGYKQYET